MSIFLVMSHFTAMQMTWLQNSGEISDRPKIRSRFTVCLKGRAEKAQDLRNGALRCHTCRTTGGFPRKLPRIDGMDRNGCISENQPHVEMDSQWILGSKKKNEAKLEMPRIPLGEI